MNSIQLNKNEWTLITFAFLVLITASTIALKGISLRHYFFQLDTLNTQVQVGVLDQLNGSARRVGNGQSTFESIQVQSPLYNLDTIFTGSQSSATLKLEDDSEIKLSPNSMIKLEFTQQLSLSGIERVPTIQIISGNIEKPKTIKKFLIKTMNEIIEVKPTVTAVEIPQLLKAQPKQELPPIPQVIPIQEIKSAGLLTPPKMQDLMPAAEPVAAVPEPIAPAEVPPATEPLKITVLSPQHQSLIAFTAVEVDTGKMVSIQLESNLETDTSELIIKKLKPTPKMIEKKRVDFSQNKAEIKVKINEPGTYIIDTKHSQTQFTVPTEVNTAIEFKPYLIAGKRIENNLNFKETKNDLDVQLAWNSIPLATQYDLKIYSKEWSTPLRSLKNPEITLDKNGYKGFPFQYVVVAQLKNGFQTKPYTDTVNFQFLAPPMSTPKNKAILGKERVLLTWKKIQFAKKYKVEISDDISDFKKPLFKKEVTENFALFYNLEPGQYFWRIFSVNGSLLSTPSQPLEFNVSDK